MPSDLRFALRSLVREPRFTIAALLTLALGIGANVAVFAVFEAVMLRRLPYAEAERLVILNHRDRRSAVTKPFIAIGDYVDLSARQTRLERLVAYGNFQATLYEPTGPVRLAVLAAGPGLFETLRVVPEHGRGLTPEDAAEGASPVALLSHDFWRSHYGGDPSLVGRSIRVGDDELQIVGIAPPGLRFPPGEPADLIFPLTIPAAAPAARKSGWTFAMGRLAPGATGELATAELAGLSRQMEEAYPTSNEGSEYYVEPLREAVVGSTGAAFPLLLAAVGVVLLIACANVANLLLVRSLGRQRELAIRQALGAGRGRLLAQMLSESLVLSAGGAVLGTLVAHWGARALVHLVPKADTLPGLAEVGINGSVLGFALALAILTTLLASLQSALILRSRSFGASLVASRGASRGPAAGRATTALVVAQVGLGIVLLLGAGLILRTFHGLITVDPGFDRSGVLTLSVSLPAGRYDTPEAMQAIRGRLRHAVEALPGVDAVGQAVVVPLTGNNWTVPFERADQPVPAGQRPPDVGWQSASGGYFSALRIPLVAGRLFDETDRPGGRPVVIVSQGIVRRFYGDSGAVGRMVKVGEDRFEIAGVVGDIHRASLRDEPAADLYFPMEQMAGGQFTLFVRAAGDPHRLVAPVRSALRKLEPDIVVDDPRTMDEVAGEDTRVTELLLWLLGVFAALAVGLAAVGLYGIMSYTVRLRTRELGTRVALGATRSDIIRLVMRRGGRIAVAGVVLGFAAGLVAVRLLRSAVYGVALTDPVTLTAAAAVMLVTTLLACYLPARRAAMVDPVETLAEE